MRDYLFFGSLGLLYIFVVIMVTLHSRCGHYIFVLWFLLLLSFYFFLVCSQPSQIGCLPYFHTWCGLSANVGCRSETYCMRLAENSFCVQKIAKNSRSAHHRTTLLGYIFATMHVSTVGKKLVKQQYLSHASWDRLRSVLSLGHPGFSTSFASWQCYCMAL